VLPARIAALVVVPKASVDVPTMQLAATVAVTVMTPVAISAFEIWAEHMAAVSKHRLNDNLLGRKEFMGNSCLKVIKFAPIRYKLPTYKLYDR
jgi:hypothetical protein